jgi:hypothetical protein
MFEMQLWSIGSGIIRIGVIIVRRINYFEKW